MGVTERWLADLAAYFDAKPSRPATLADLDPGVRWIMDANARRLRAPRGAFAEIQPSPTLTVGADQPPDYSLTSPPCGRTGAWTWALRAPPFDLGAFLRDRRTCHNQTRATISSCAPIGHRRNSTDPFRRWSASRLGARSHPPRRIRSVSTLSRDPLWGPFRGSPKFRNAWCASPRLGTSSTATECRRNLLMCLRKHYENS
jgi:hypothetical protein